MAHTFTATATVAIDAPVDTVWHALTDPTMIERYYFGTHVSTDWKVGSPITWEGEWNGTHYADRGTVVEYDEPRRLRMTHYSPMTGQPDIPENYHTLSYQLGERAGTTVVELTQDNASSADEAQHDEQNWKSMLDSLKALLEGN